MGNLAVKCEAQWQTKKSEGRCHVGTRVDVTVIRPDGKEAQEFDRPVVAAEVMHQFPDYVVVHWCPHRTPELGKRYQLRVLQRHEVLTPGRLYYLFPIPAEVAKNNTSDLHNPRRSRRMQSSKDHLAKLLQRSESQSTNADGAEEVQPAFPGFSSWKLLMPNDAAGDEGSFTTEDGEEKKALFPPGFNAWRPALLSIPESPLGFHSRPDSPMTPIAFRLVRSYREQDPSPDSREQ